MGKGNSCSTKRFSSLFRLASNLNVKNQKLTRRILRQNEILNGGSKFKICSYKIEV